MEIDQIFLFLMILSWINYCYPYETPNNTEQLKLAHTCILTNGTKYDKPPVILLHGIFAFKEIWMNLMPLLALKTGRRVCAADLRNHGDSPWSEKSDTITMASDLNLLMKTIKAEKIALIGHSLGGKIAADFTLTNPAKVEKLIVEDMRPNGLSEEAREMIQKNGNPFKSALTLIPRGATEKEAKFLVFKIFKFLLQLADEFLDIDEGIVDYVPIICSNGKCNWKANVDLFEKVKKNLEKFMPNIKGKFENPALFVYGGKSPFKVGDVKGDILKLFPKTKFVQVQKASHMVHPFAEYKDAVVNFLNAEN